MVEVRPPTSRVQIGYTERGEAVWIGTQLFDLLREILDRIGGEGDVTLTTNISAGSSTDQAIVRFDGTSGSDIQNSNVTVSDGGSIALPANETVDGRDVSDDGAKLDGIEAGAEVNDVDSVFGRTGTITAQRGDYAGNQITQGLEVHAVAVDQADLASGGSVVLVNADTGERYKVREVRLVPGTNFDVGGDRDLEITDGTTVWSAITQASLQSQSISAWGESDLPYPSSASAMTTASAAGNNIVARYTGGTTDNTTGLLTLILIVERTA